MRREMKSLIGIIVMVVIVLVVMAFFAMSINQKVYPSYIEKAISSCEGDEGVKHIWVNFHDYEVTCNNLKVIEFKTRVHLGEEK